MHYVMIWGWLLNEDSCIQESKYYSVIIYDAIAGWRENMCNLRETNSGENGFQVPGEGRL